MKLTEVVIAAIGLQQLFGCAQAAVQSIDIATCDDLQTAVALTASSGSIEGVLVDGGVKCDEWTTFEVKNDKLKLVGPEDTDDDFMFEFENVRFLVSSGILRVDVPVSFTTGAANGRQEVDGGVLKVAEGAYVRFRAEAQFTDVTILSVPDEGSDYTSDRWYGGCIYNEGELRFEDFFRATNCATVGGGDSSPGDGGGIYNGPTGQVVFKGKMWMIECGTFDNEGNHGGAIHNQGKITMFKIAKFYDNASARGGAIDNTSSGTIKFLKNAIAKFRRNRTYDSGSGGGQVHNGGLMKFNGGAVFSDGFTEEDGGAIYNSGTVTISKFAEFEENRSNGNGGAIASPESATFELPVDTAFLRNTVTYDWDDCNDWYQKTDDGYVCLP